MQSENKLSSGSTFSVLTTRYELIRNEDGYGVRLTRQCDSAPTRQAEVYLGLTLDAAQCILQQLAEGSVEPSSLCDVLYEIFYEKIYSSAILSS